MKNKILIIIGIFLIVSLFTIPFASASPVTLYTAASGNTEHPLYYANPYNVAQSFTVGASDTRLVTVSWLLSKSGSPTGTLTCKLYNSAGEIPLTYIETSNYFYNIASLPTGGFGSAVWVNFTFSESDIWLDSSTAYAVSLELMSDAGHVNNTNYVAAWYQTFDVTSGGCKSTWSSSTALWSAQATNDYRVIVMGDTDATPTPTPVATPTPSPTPEAMPNWISDIIDAIIPIFTPLLVIFICGALGWRFAGAWGFFGGINLAVVLMYVVAPQYMPLWSIVAVVIVDIALLFGKVGFDRR